MFLGTHNPLLDEKGQLFLPAKFRDKLAGTLIIIRGQERCLYVFAMAGFELLTTDDEQHTPVTNWPVSNFQRVLLSVASDEIPNMQDRVTISAVLREYVGLRRDCMVIGAGNRAEVWNTQNLERLPDSCRGRFRRAGRGGDS